jgi:hypothetical protein
MNSGRRWPDNLSETASAARLNGMLAQTGFGFEPWAGVAAERNRCLSQGEGADRPAAS